jgi:hypothetical protein
MNSARLDAAREGRLQYDGQPCRTCGTTLKYTKSGACVQCAKTKTEAQREKVRQLLDAAAARAGA